MLKAQRGAILLWVGNIRFYQIGQLDEGYLPAEVTGVKGNDLGNARLFDMQLCANRHVPGVGPFQ